MVRLGGLVLACAALVACGDVERRTVTLRRVTPPAEPSCGAPPDARTVLITALGEFPPDLNTGDSLAVGAGDLAIDQFPATTRVLQVRVEGPDAAERAIGRTRELALGELADGAELYVLVAPPQGTCRVGPPAVARAAPLVARAGRGALVAGGRDADGAPVTEVEWYDPDRGAFDVLAGTFYGDGTAGLAGATMTRLADGRVVVAGGAREAYQVFDPDRAELDAARLLPGRRAHHAAAALPDGRLLLAGGCGVVDDAGACAGALLADTVIIDVDTGDPEPGPPLLTARAGARAFVEADGRLLVTGGVDGSGVVVTTAERLDLAGGAANEGIANAGGSGVALASGAVLTAFGAGAASPAVREIPPHRGTAVVVADAPAARTGHALVALHDGSALALGGTQDDGAAEAAMFDPARERFVDVALPGVAARRDAGVVVLDDGAVLVIGGLDRDGAALPDAYVFRPELTGPYTSELFIAASGSAQSSLLTPSDPSRSELVPAGERAAHVRLTGSGAGASAPSEWLIAAGPVFAAPDVALRAGASDGGLAVVLAFADARTFAFVALGAGATRLAVVTDGIARTVCEGEPADLAGAQTPTIEVVAGDPLTASVDGEVLLSCALPEPLAPGAVGVGVLGGDGAEVRLETLQVTR